MAKIELNEKQTKALLDRIWQDHSFGLAERDKHSPSWENWRDQYDSEWTELTQLQDDEDLDQWFYVPKTFMQIHRIECSLQQHFFPTGSGKLGKVVAPSTKGQLPAVIATADAVLHAKLDLEGRPQRSLPDAWNSGLIEGNGWVKVSWERKSRKMDDGTTHTINRPRIEYIDNESIIHDPYAKREPDIEWVIHVVWLTEEELWQRQLDGIYENVDQVVGGSDEGPQDPWRQEVTQPENKPRKLYCVMEFWGPQQLNTQEELDALHRQGKHRVAQDVVATVYQNKALLRLEDNRYAGLLDNPDPLDKLPFFKCTPLPQRGSTYGQSFVNRMRPIQREINTLRNQRRVAVESELNRKVFYDENRLTDLDRLFQAQYHGYVGVNGPPRDAVYDFAPLNSTAGLDREEQVMDADLRDVTGVTHYKMGGVVEGMQKTATGVTSVMAEGNVKVDTIIENVAMSLVRPLTEFVTECAIEWVTPEEVNQIFGFEGPEPPELRSVLKHDYHIQLEAGASATSKQVRIQQSESLLAYTAQLANAMPQQAMAVLMLLMPELFNLMGFPEAAAKFNETVEQMPEQVPPSGQGQEAPPRPDEQRRQLAQGRPRTPQEVTG